MNAAINFPCSLFDRRHLAIAMSYRTHSRFKITTESGQHAINLYSWLQVKMKKIQLNFTEVWFSDVFWRVYSLNVDDIYTIAQLYSTFLQLKNELVNRFISIKPVCLFLLLVFSLSIKMQNLDWKNPTIWFVEQNKCSWWTHLPTAFWTRNVSQRKSKSTTTVCYSDIIPREQTTAHFYVAFNGIDQSEDEWLLGLWNCLQRKWIENQFISFLCITMSKCYTFINRM